MPTGHPYGTLTSALLSISEPWGTSMISLFRVATIRPGDRTQAINFLECYFGGASGFCFYDKLVLLKAQLLSVTF